MCLRTGRELPRSPLRGDEVLFMAQKQRKIRVGVKICS